MIVIHAPPYRLVRIEPEQVDSILREIRPLLDQAVARTAGHLTLEDMIAKLRQGWREWMLWVCIADGAVVGAMIVTMERCHADLIATYELLASIDAQEAISALLAPFEEYLAAIWGVTAVRIVGRRGWERFLAKHGFSASHFITSKRLIDSARLAGNKQQTLTPGESSKAENIRRWFR